MTPHLRETRTNALKSFETKKALVVGLGRSGRAAAGLLVSLGSSVVATDVLSADALGIDPEKWKEKGIGLALGGHPAELLDGVDLVVTSPGIPLDVPIIALARAKGVPVVGELELAYEVAHGSWIGVTGTNGKSTTTSLIGAMLAQEGMPVIVGGNIGFPLSAEIEKLHEGALVVAEVSSFQLETTVLFRPHVSVLLNVTEDHLDRYGSMDEYKRAKARIFMNQTGEDLAVLNTDDPTVRDIARSISASIIPTSLQEQPSGGVYVKEGVLVSEIGGGEEALLPAGEIRIPGPHNLMNCLAAAAAAMSVGVSPENVAAVLRRFPPLEHRMETVFEADGVLYVNDSKATNVDSVKYALESYGAAIVLIAGGKDKGTGFEALRPQVERHVKHLVLIGQAAPAMQETFRGLVEIELADSLGEAVRLAARAASPGDVVLLSPACASFDMFEDFEDRGRRFKTEVMKLVGEKPRGVKR